MDISRSREEEMQTEGLATACSSLEQIHAAPGEAMLEGFVRGNATASADCWLHTETLEYDLRKCLELFEARTGQSANLDRFDKVAASVQKAHDNSASEHLLHDGFEGESVQPCSFYYDQETRGF